MTASDENSSTHHGADDEFSRWRDIKQRFLAIIWYDVEVRFRFLLVMTVFVVAAILTPILE